MSRFGRFAKVWIGFAALVLGAALLPFPAVAQTFFGSVVGTVTDPSGAVVPGASVTITNLGTNESRTQQSGAGGEYQFVNLVPANYRVTVESPSFKRAVRQPIEVAVGGTVRSDVRLEVGAATETVQVTTDVPLLQTDSGSLGSVVEGKTVQQMPLNGRNVLNLIALVPGVVPQGATSGSLALNAAGGTNTNPQSWGNYQIGGGIAQQSLEYYDGVMLDVIGDVPALVPSQDATQEFRVEMNSVTPEFGGFSGGVVEMTSKSGSNEIHGSAYEYLRNKVLNANSFFSNHNGIQRQEWNQNQYGVVVSGPAIKDKLFGFFAWEHFVSRIGVPSTSNTPTTTMQSGIISDPSGAVFKNRTALALCPTMTNDGTNTTIPQSCWDVTAKVMKNAFPPPDTTNAIGKSNWYSVPVSGANQDQYNGRGDWVISPKQRLFARYSWWTIASLAVPIYGNYNGFNTSNAVSTIHSMQGVLGDTFTLSPSTILDVRLGFTRLANQTAPAGSEHLDMSLFGPAWAALAAQMSYQEYPVPSLSGAYGVNSFHPLDFTSVHHYVNESIAASFTKILGPHTLKVGTEERLMVDVMDGVVSGALGDPSGYFAFDRTYIPDEWAAFLLGYPTSGSIHTTAPRGAYAYTQAYYVNDVWQASRKLTLNFGLRWDLPEALAERHDKSTVLLPDTVDSYTGVRGTLGLVASNLYGPRTTQVTKYDAFQPRVGFAYRLTDNTAVHGGYGLVFVPTDVGGASPVSAVIDSAGTTLTNTGSAPYARYSNPWPNGITQPSGRTNPAFMTHYASSTAYLGQTASGPYPWEPYGYNQQWNLSVGQQMKGDWMVEAAYVGAKGTHLPSGTYSIDELSSQYYPSLNATLAGFGSNPTSAQITSLINLGQGERPYPAYHDLQNTNKNAGDSNYDSLQLQVQKRFRSGGSLGASYVWSKFISDTDSMQPGSDPHGTSGTTGSSGAVQDYNNPRGERSIISFDIPQRVVINYVLNLPFGQGQRFGANTHGVVSSAISGWGVNGITTFESGTPAYMSTASGNYLTNNWGGGLLRPNYTPGCNKTVSGPWFQRFQNGQAFNTACFSQPGPIQFGNEPRVDGALRSQGVDNFDFAVLKTTTIHEQMNVQFRAEFFNLFNHPQFEPPSWIYGNQFGRILSQLNLQRVVQVSLRLNY